jgi:hypothetical protein
MRARQLRAAPSAGSTAIGQRAHDNDIVVWRGGAACSAAQK